MFEKVNWGFPHRTFIAPTGVPMNASGALDVDHRTKRHSIFVALVSQKPIPRQCVNLRSGAYKKTEAVSLFFGTSEPDLMPANALPYTDPARLAAKYNERLETRISIGFAAR